MSKKKIKKNKNLAGLRKSECADIQNTLTLAIQHHRAGQLGPAMNLYQKILALQPQNPSVNNLLGLALNAAGQSEEALLFLTKAASLSPGTTKFHYDLGVILYLSGREDESIRHYQAALALAPENGEAWENLGVALFDCGLNQEAVNAFEMALKLNSESIIGLTNLATLRRWQGLHQQALELLNRAILVDPTHSSARLRRAELLLSLGDYKNGWEEYSWRLIGAGRPGQDQVHFVPSPKWDGQSREGQSLLIYTEQGIGDEVMFASCLPDLQAMGIDTHFLCDPRMVSAFRRSFPELKVSANVAPGWGTAGEIIQADMRIPVGDLPKLFRQSSDSFSRQDGYLKADPGLSRHWCNRLDQAGPGLKIGISWRGGRQKYNQRARSIALDVFTPLLSLPGVVFVNLQYGDCQIELCTLPETLRSKILTFDEVDPLVELEPFLALIANLDLVISVDNSTVHFAGALGVPTWLLLPALADWRWPVEGADSRWYPSVQLIRQLHCEKDTWGPTIERVVQKISTVTPRDIELMDVAEDEKNIRSTGHFLGGGRPRALLLNDTSFWYHWGCTCTSLAIRNNLTKRGWEVRGVPIHHLRSLQPLPVDFSQWNDGLFESFRKVQKELCDTLDRMDVLVVNGEGSLHGNGPLPTHLLYLMHIAKTRFGKTVHVINHSCYPDDQAAPSGSAVEKVYQRVYSELDHVAVREPISLNLLAKLGIRAQPAFDCLPLFVEQFRSQIEKSPSSQILFSGSVAWDQAVLEVICQLVKEFADGRCRYLFGANAFPAGDDIAMLQQLQKALPGGVEVLFAKSEFEWLSHIASAKILVSGRFHHSIAAACLNTPFIVLDSNTPKISGLMQVLDLQNHVRQGEPGFALRLMELVTELQERPERGRLTAANHQKILRLAANNFTGLD